MYLLKSSALLAAFFLAYWLLLRRETFFNSNRWFLLAGLFTAVLLPLVSFTKVVWVDAAPRVYQWMPVTPQQAPVEQGFTIDWSLLLTGLYATGIFVFLIRFLFDFASLARTLKGHGGFQQGNFTMVDAPHIHAPFSYFNYIAYNSQLYSNAELENIIAHEKVHCAQKHSLDVLVMQLFCILFWFNPMVWLYRKAMLQNLEFIADREALAQLEDRKSYQFTLLKVTARPQCVAITNSFYQSLIKKRIMMLNQNQSRKVNVWKYTLVLPLLAAFLLCFQVRTVAQERESAGTPPPPPPPIVTNNQDVVINKRTSDAELKTYTQDFAKQGAKLKFSKVKRNASGEITSVKIQYDDNKGQTGSWHVKSDDPIEPLRIGKDVKGNIALGSPKQVRVVSRHVEHDDQDSDSTDVHNYAYTYDYDGENAPEITVNGNRIEMPDMARIMADVRENINVQTHTDKNGRISMTINGEHIDIDPEKILAEIDIEGIKAQARAGADEARRQVEAMRPQMEQARIKRMEARRSADEARRKGDDARREADDARREADEARREMDEARREMDAARADMEKARQEIAKARAQLSADKKALEAKKKSSKNQ